MSIIGVVGTAASWRYELAVILPARDKDADELVIISFWASIITSLLTLIGVICCHSRIASLLGNREIEPWLYLIPVSIFLFGVYNALNYWLNRKECYRNMSYARVIRSGSGSGGSIGLGFFRHGAGGLIVGNLTGQLLSTIFMANIFLRQENLNFLSNFHQKIYLAKKYKRHPIHLLPSHLVGTAANQIPVLVISAFFGVSVVGFYSLALRMISVPSSLIANAIGDVYRQQISLTYAEKGEFRDLFVRTLFRSFVFAIAPFSVIFFIAPDFFAIVFGETWRVAGEYARILVIAAFFQFIYAPVDKGALVVGATRYIFFWHMARFFGFLGITAFIFWGNIEFHIVLWSLVAVNSTLYIIDIMIGYKFSIGLPKS